MSTQIDPADTDTENRVVADLALDTTDRAHTVWAEADDVGNLVAHQTVHRAGYGTEHVDVRTHEALLAAPHRQRGLTNVTSVDSFTRLTNRLGDENTVVFADLQRRSLTSVLNYEGGWGDHRIAYSTLPSPEWEKWTAADGKWMNQRAFAELLQDLRHTITDPDAADIVQIARTFTATKSARFESGVRLQSGDVQFSYVEETRAKSGPSGGTVEVPEEITLTLPIFRDSDVPSVVDLEFRYDASEDGLKLGYRILRRDEVVEAAWNGLVTRAREAVVASVVDGPAPDPVSPIA